MLSVLSQMHGHAQLLGDCHTGQPASCDAPAAWPHSSACDASPCLPQTTSFNNLFIAGDWVKGLDHGANGLSQAGTGSRNILDLCRGKGVELLGLHALGSHDWLLIRACSYFLVSRLCCRSGRG